MGTLNLTDPVNGTTADASLIANNNAATKTVVNGGIDNTNINASAAIALSKLAGYPSDATKFARGDGTWAVPSASGGAGTELAYATFTSPVSVTATSEGTANSVVSAGSVAYDGTAIRIKGFFPTVQKGTGAITLSLQDGTTSLAILNDFGATTAFYGVIFEFKLTPSAASHTYNFKAFVDGGTGTVGAGAGGAGTRAPGFILITKA